MYKKILSLLMITICFILIGCKKGGTEKEFNAALEMALENNYTIKNTSSVNDEEAIVYFTKIDKDKIHVFFDNESAVETYFYTRDGFFFKGVSSNDVFTEILIKEDEYNNSKFNLFSQLEYDDFDYQDDEYILKDSEYNKYFDILFPDAKMFSEFEGFKYENMSLTFTVVDNYITSIKAKVDVSYKLGQLVEMKYSSDLQLYDYGNTNVVIPE